MWGMKQNREMWLKWNVGERVVEEAGVFMCCSRRASASASPDRANHQYWSNRENRRNRGF